MGELVEHRFSLSRTYSRRAIFLSRLRPLVMRTVGLLEERHSLVVASSLKDADEVGAWIGEARRAEELKAFFTHLLNNTKATYQMELFF